VFLVPYVSGSRKDGFLNDTKEEIEFGRIFE